MGFTQKMFNLPISAGKKNKFKKPSITVTTNDFFVLKPVYSREIVPNQSTKIDCSMFSRMASMPNPAYARIKFVNRAFFVRYQTVWRGFPKFLSQTRNSDGAIPSKVPFFTQTNLFTMFVYFASQNLTNYCSIVDSHPTSETDPTPIPDGPYDLYIVNTLGEPLFLKFGKFGKILYDIFINLGYNLPKSYDLSDDEGKWNIEFSALPFLCYCKIWYDWYRNNKYDFVLPNGKTLDYYFDRQDSYQLSEVDLRNICIKIVDISYPVDYFTAASKNPITSINQEPVQTAEDITQAGTLNEPIPNVSTASSSNKNLYSTPLTAGSNTSRQLSDYLLKVLNHMTDFMMRDNLIGGKTLDRILAHYGVRVPSLLLDRSVYLGKFEQDLTIMDVTQTSGSIDPSNDSYTQLGYQGGRGLTTNQSQGQFEYETGDDIFGQLIILSQVIPEVSYYQGVKREMLHLLRFDFFTSEYDSLGMQLMYKSELWNGFMHFEGDPTIDPLIFDNRYDEGYGFIDRYAEYKQSTNQDVLSGDFRVKSAGSDQLQSYQLFRQLYSTSFDDGKIVTNINFDHVNGDLGQYDRMFDWADSFDDHFITFYNFDVVDYMPMRPLFESYDFGDDEEHSGYERVSKNGTMF